MELCGDTKAPEGWLCTRVLGHEGPCAAKRIAYEKPYYLSSESACPHGLAWDMHCCECKRSGFFPPDDCECYG